MTQVVDIRDIERLNAQKGKHWFEADTLRFFRSRYAGTAVVKAGGAYFTSSERGPDMSRRYSVCRMDMETGSVDSIGGFQAYATLSQAKAALKRVIADCPDADHDQRNDEAAAKWQAEADLLAETTYPEPLHTYEAGQ